MSVQPRAGRFATPRGGAPAYHALWPVAGPAVVSASGEVVAPLPRGEKPRAPGFYRDRLKRALDIVLVLICLPVALPLVGALALVIALRGGQPFYGQQRVGRDGRIFTMWKLRSMVRDADRKLEAHLARDPSLRAEWDAHQKLRRDPRITAFGQFLRRSSLDELPQLWNILKGDMSIVGPRPMMPEQQRLYPGTAYYGLRPGLTGLWQISDRNASVFAYRAECDTRYDRSLSLLLDLRVMLRTVGVVLRGTGY